MKKLYTLILICICLIAKAQTPFLNTPYTRDNLTNIKNRLLDSLGKSYSFDYLRLLTHERQAHIRLIKADSNRVDITVNSGIINADLDEGKRGDTVIDNIAIAGTFRDILSLYQRIFNVKTDDEAIKAKGYAQPIILNEGKQKVAIAFVRNSLKQGYWDLWIRKI